MWAVNHMRALASEMDAICKQVSMWERMDVKETRAFLQRRTEINRRLNPLPPGARRG
jgi:hypothetical protein